MKNMIIAVIGLCALFVTSIATAEDRPMGFFITSVGVGNDGDLGGLKGADSHCQKLATAAGA